MWSADEQNTPVKVKAAVIDAASMTVEWANEAAREGLSEQEGTCEPISIEQVVPMVKPLGVREALSVVADTGVPRHLQADVVSTSKGSMALVVSIYRLPDGMLLVLSENAWRSDSGKAADARPQRSRRRVR